MRSFVVFLLLAMTLCWCSRARADEPAHDDADYVKKALDEKLPLFDENNLNPVSAGQYLAGLGNLNVVVDTAALVAAGYKMDQRVYLSAKNITLRTALDRLVKDIQTAKNPLQWDLESGVVVLSTQDDKNWRSLAAATGKYDKEPAYNDDSVIDLDMDDLSLEKALKELRLDKINLYVHWDALQAVKVDPHTRVSLLLKRVHPRTAMQMLVRQLAGPSAEVSFAVYDGVWVISTPEDIEKQMHLWEWRPHHVQDQATADKLAMMLNDATFDATPISDAIESLSRMTDSTIDFDWSSTRDANIDRKTPVSFSVWNVKYSTAIDLLLTEASGNDHTLDYTAKEGTVSIALKPEKKPATKPATKATNP